MEESGKKTGILSFSYSHIYKNYIEVKVSTQIDPRQNKILFFGNF